MPPWENPSRLDGRKRKMPRKFVVPLLALLSMIFLLAIPAKNVRASSITTSDIIDMMNSQRTHHGLAALVRNSILDSVAQGDAEYMLATHLLGDIGGVKQRVLNAGYGGGQNAWATENWAMDFDTIEEIKVAWSDDLHMIPVNNPNYKNVGAGIATDGTDTYYVLVAAYIEGGIAAATTDPLVTKDPTTSQYMAPVVTSTPNSDGSISLIVQPGQTLWSIAIAYGMHIDEIKSLNKLTSDTVYVGQPLILRLAPTITITPTITVTPPLPTRTPAPSQYLKLPTRTSFPTATATPTPIVPGLGSIDRRTLGIIIIAVCALGLAGVLLVSSLRKKPSKPE